MGIFDDDLPGPPAPAAKPAIAKVRYTHDAMIDLILSRPEISQAELAKQFGFTQTWISIVVNSDSFKERMAERKAELLDPKIKASLDERVFGAANRAMDRLIDRLDSDTHGSIKTQDLVAIAKLAVAPKQTAPAAPQNNLYVVQLPAPAQNSQAWLANVTGANRTPRGSSEIIELPTGG